MKVREIAKGQFRLTIYIKISQTQDAGTRHPGSAHNTRNHPLPRQVGLDNPGPTERSEKKAANVSVVARTTSPVTVARATIKPETFVCVRFGDVTTTKSTRLKSNQ